MISIRETYAVNVCISTVDRAIGRFRYTYKQVTHRATAANTPENHARRLEL